MLNLHSVLTQFAADLLHSFTSFEDLIVHFPCEILTGFFGSTDSSDKHSNENSSCHFHSGGSHILLHELFSGDIYWRCGQKWIDNSGKCTTETALCSISHKLNMNRDAMARK